MGNHGFFIVGGVWKVRRLTAERGNDKRLEAAELRGGVVGKQWQIRTLGAQCVQPGLLGVLGVAARLCGLGLGVGGLGVELREEVGGVASVADFGEAGVIAVNGRKFGFG